MLAQLAEWERDDAVAHVVITASGGRAFSAGGDLRSLYELGRAGRYEEALAYFRDEYTLNTRIKRYRKPYIALIDGIVMGGGVGVSAHGWLRVAGDRFSFAMPEVSIGFFPDVGATWLLPRLPGELGTFCALTGERLGAADAVAAGIASRRVPSARFPDLLEGLCAIGEAAALLDLIDRFALETGETKLPRAAIDRLFAGERVEDVLAALDAEAAGGAFADFARATATTIRSKSPLSLKIALKQMRLGPDLHFEACMRTEFRIVSRVVRGHDVYEGIRAVIVDKDQAPRWQPATLEAVSDAEVARYFAPLERELDLP
jgi:enoyl-CoA hydratase